MPEPQITVQKGDVILEKTIWELPVITGKIVMDVQRREFKVYTYIDGALLFIMPIKTGTHWYAWALEQFGELPK